MSKRKKVLNAEHRSTCAVCFVRMSILIKLSRESKFDVTYVSIPVNTSETIFYLLIQDSGYHNIKLLVGN
jgi:hypothetical protein